MRTVNNFSIEKESFEDQCKARRWNPCLEISFRDKRGVHRHKLESGNNDNIHVFREAGFTYVVATNHHLGYVALDVFEGSKRIGDIFLEHHNLVEALGRDDFEPITLAQRLKEYVLQ